MGISVVSSLVAMLGGCSLRLPYTVSDLREASARRAGRALVHYLGQRGADPSVCDRRAPEFALRSFEIGDVDRFVEGLSERRVRPDIWERCAAHLLHWLPPEVGRHAVGAATNAMADELRAEDGGAGAIDRLAAVESLLVRRPHGLDIGVEVESSLRAATRGAHVAPVAAVHAEAVLEIFDLDRGAYRGAPVDAARIATIEDRGVLTRMSHRLPAEGLRNAARARLVDLAIAASAFPEVRADPGARDRVLRTGRNAIDVVSSGVSRAWYSGPGADYVVVAEQDLRAQTVRFLARRSGSEDIVPSFSLRGMLLFELPGFSRAVTLCGPAVETSVDPCVDSGVLAVATPIGRLDADGALHFADRLPILRAVAVLEGDRVPVPIALAENVLARTEPRLELVPPRAQVFMRGEDLAVTLERRGNRVLAGIREVSRRGAGDPSWVIFESGHVGRFAIVSRGVHGANGAAGSAGTRGHDGTSGRSASCPHSRGDSGSNGGAGGRGGNGQPGHLGGRGGDIDVLVRCAPDECAAAAELAARLVRSEGGPGGQGGAGGRGGDGGRGGSGGSGTSCRDQDGRHTSLSGGMRGTDGMRGSDGMRGHQGLPGPSGDVRIHVEPRVDAPAQ